MNKYFMVARKFLMHFIVLFLVAFLFLILPKGLVDDKPWAEMFTEVFSAFGYYFVYVLTAIYAIIAVIFMVLGIIHRKDKDVDEPKSIDEMNDEWMMKLVDRLTEMGFILYMSPTPNHDASSSAKDIDSDDEGNEGEFLDNDDE